MIELKFYTDGAYSSSRNAGGIGIVCLQNNDVVLEYSRKYKNTTNNRMEIKAVLLALNSVKGKVDKITIVSDSQYVIGCATKGWKKEKNKDLWKKYDEIYEKVSQLCSDITFEWVHGHNGDKYNEIVDKLAVRASQSL